MLEWDLPGLGLNQPQRSCCASRGPACPRPCPRPRPSPRPCLLDLDRAAPRLDSPQPCAVSHMVLRRHARPRTWRTGPKPPLQLAYRWLHPSSVSPTPRSCSDPHGRKAVRLLLGRKRLCRADPQRDACPRVRGPRRQTPEGKHVASYFCRLLSEPRRLGPAPVGSWSQAQPCAGCRPRQKSRRRQPSGPRRHRASRIHSDYESSNSSHPR
mmetsp:Transcript_10607/g.25893  ORF Transcript_10607/g.25893 Transcript_10607/m.25893 type:complete len:211 (+) Transcript_10607:1199-1831(+)